VNLKKHSFIFLFLVSAFFCFPQQGSKVVIDSITKLPVGFASIGTEDPKISFISNKDGRFMPFQGSKIKRYIFYKMGYHQRALTEEELAKADTVFLLQKPAELEAITVRARIMDTMVKDKRFYVNDYLVLPNNNFLLVTSKLNVPGFELCYYVRDKGITQSKKIKNEKEESLYTDCFKNIHLLTGSFSRQIFFSSDSSFEFLPKYSRSRFDSTLAICALKVDSQVIIRTSKPPQKISGALFNTQVNSPFLTYLRVSAGKRVLFHSVVYNPELREMLDNELRDGSMMNANVKDIGGKALSSEAIAAQRLLFFSKVAAPIYAPIFLRNDSVIIFNFQENRIEFLDKWGKSLRTVDLDQKNYSALRDFEVIYDEWRQKFYIRSRDFDHSFLNRIDIYSGQISKKIKIEKTFAKNIQVLNDHIYYLVKEKEWDDTSYLYRQNP
jgi:hypothetical protein